MSQTIGLTGSIATGKSTVSKILAAKGIPVVDADIAARKVVQKGSAGLKQIKATFGSEFITKSGELDRAKMGNLIFHDQQKRMQLNQIVHPLVREYMLKERSRLLSSGETLIIFDIPLLFESNLTTLVDKIIVVAVNSKTQLKRLMARNQLSKKEAQKRISSQIAISDKIKLADYVIDNNASLIETEHQVNRLIEELYKNK